MCKVYGNRRPLICVQRHSSSTGATRHAESFHRDDGGGDDDDGDDNHANREDDPDEVVDQAREKSLGTVKGKGKEPPPAVGVKPLVEPAGSQAEADDLAREDRQQFGSTTNTNTHKQVGGGDDGEEEVPGTKPPAGWSKADQELQDELQAERRRKRKRRRRAAAAAAPRQGPISTWEACPKVLHSEHHDYFEFIVRFPPPPLSLSLSFPEELNPSPPPLLEHNQLCNAGFAALAIAVLVFRQRTLALQQFGRLAARIMQTQSSSV